MAVTGFSAGYDTALIKQVLGFASGGLALPAHVEAALFKTAVFGTAKVVGTEWTTSDSTAYARVDIGIDSTNWNVAAFVAGTGTVATNAIQKAFAAYVAGAASQSIFTVGFMDAASGGNLQFFADLAASISVSAGIIVQFNVADIALTLL